MEQQMELGLTQLNKLPRERLTEELLRICGSTRWAGKVSQTFPHTSVADALQAIDKLWWFLEKEDWLEAFSAHPRIGDAAALRKVLFMRLKMLVDVLLSTQLFSPCI